MTIAAATPTESSDDVDGLRSEAPQVEIQEVELTKEEIASQLLEQLDEFGIEISIQDTIRLYAIKHGVDVNLALNIACSESRFEANAKNPHSTASGVFQFLNGTFKGYGVKYWGSLDGRDVFDARDNIELAMYVLADVGTRDWNASKTSWAAKPYEQGLCPK